LNRFGWQITRINEVTDEMLVKILHDSDVDLVIDVGANIGQYALSIFNSRYQGRVLSFEPQSEAYSLLCSNLSSWPRWSAAPRCALGSIPGKQSLNISTNSVSSSLLDMESKHLHAAPSSAYASTEIVDVIRLDDVDFIAQRPFLKIDAQGYEGHILDGAGDTLVKAFGVQIEISLTELYSGQPSYLEILNRLDKLGFRIWDIKLGFRDKISRRLLQADVIMFKA
jgi:FkbM family methyltransferase